MSETLACDNGAVPTEYTAPTEPAASTGPDVWALSSSVIYSDRWIRLRRDEIERRDGGRGTYAVIDRADFALVIPAESGGFHLVEEFRYPIERRTWSFPQGGFPHGQTGTLEELAALELAQETGLRAGTLRPLGAASIAHGMCSQFGHYFLATDLVPGPPDREPEEQDMRQAWVERAEFEQMVRDGRIVDNSSLSAYALLGIAERRGEIRL
jgi:8-oxo-dGTP pyrophosphatase MutT (NUDIX family)